MFTSETIAMRTRHGADQCICKFQSEQTEVLTGENVIPLRVLQDGYGCRSV